MRIVKRRGTGYYKERLLTFKFMAKNIVFGAPPPTLQKVVGHFSYLISLKVVERSGNEWKNITNIGGSRISERVAPTPEVGMPTYYLTKISQNLHENKRIGLRRSTTG